ncbi:hypothetical protein [Cellulophaga sp. Hel_I_12]|uniref:hypothetical protein n=1 Tax=Cellulophaga sp. Hel_I_12 TaxID=1249972 RepID=UPI0006467509|nr:hypothetical protein [Cellulophaga sp. Hel_I_12]
MKNRTSEQLRSKLNANKLIYKALIILLTLLTAFSIYGLIAKDNVQTFIALLAVACTCWSFIPLSFNAIKEIKSELKLREHTN